ncbi:MAG: hypothetical protein DMF93_16465 [Acidobacteria bacterium]|nr:MAG: hypothetical protein DMF93_16465 [Acidobacteriota bacterium]
MKLDSLQPVPTTTAAPRRMRKRTILVLLALSFIGFVAAVLSVIIANVPLSPDILRTRMVAALSDKLDSDVEIGELALRVYPTLRIEGTNLRIRRRGAASGLPPLITVKSFHVDGSLLALSRKHVEHVKLDGLDINVPPKSERVQQRKIRHEEPQPQATAGPADAPPRATDRPDTPNERKRDPLNDGGVVTMHRLGATKPWPFDATLTNGVPPGEIVTHGDFGPWSRDEPGDTPVKGNFDFAKADLGVFKGISGILSSRGSFQGTLDEIHANGETDTPDFTVAVGGHRFALHTKYRATIDGTNGDTRLEQIDAAFLNSHLLAKGAVLDAPKGQHGRTVALEVTMDQARVEDVMVMAVRTPKPPMTGGLRLTTKFLLPPGERDVSQRLRLDGRFVIASTKFTNYDVQGRIDELSKRSRGDADQPGRPNVVSNFQGRFTLADGRLALPDLTFFVPGAKVELAGGYALKPETLDFKGQVVLDSPVSDMVTGWKKWLLKPADSIFAKPKKDGKGSIIPIKVQGTRSEPKFGLDVRSVLKRRG